MAGIGWVPHDMAVADIFAGDFQSNSDNEKLVRLTTADGYAGADKAKVEYMWKSMANPQRRKKSGRASLPSAR